MCSHACCAARPFCVVEALREVKKAYVEGRDKDPFKMKARPAGAPILGCAIRAGWAGQLASPSLSFACPP